MLTLPMDSIDSLHPIHTYAASVFHALAREEYKSKKPKRLTEPDLATWKQFRGRLTLVHFFKLLLEDGAISQPFPFEIKKIRVKGNIDFLSEELIKKWISSLDALDLDVPSRDYILTQAKLLQHVTKLPFKKLNKPKPHHKVLEIPGTGGLLSHALVNDYPDLFLQDSFTIACSSWQELTLAGVVAVECGISGKMPIIDDPKLEYCREPDKTYDVILGLHPDRGGAWNKEFLGGRFPQAQIQLI